jgi:hypothetical protein
MVSVSSAPVATMHPWAAVMAVAIRVCLAAAAASSFAEPTRCPPGYVLIEKPEGTRYDIMDKSS